MKFDEIDALALSVELASDAPPVVIDVREDFERAIAFIESSVHIPKDELLQKVSATLTNPDQPVVLYCAAGTRSLMCAAALAQHGYTHVRSLSGGIKSWQHANQPVSLALASKRPEDSPRYARHLRIPEVGPSGQKTLLAARVLLIGAGGLGSPAALYLAAAGVGTLGIVDFDRVDETNLHRQILFRTGDVGRSKVETARATLVALNPDTQVVSHDERFVADNAARIAEGYDLIVDGTDNFATRYLINDICLKLGIPNVHGSIHRFEGQASVFCSEGGACYRCLYPEPPPPGLVPSCAEAGVLGVLPGVIGCLQATEAIKLILGIGTSLSGRLLRFDALTMTFETFTLTRREDCEWCDPEGTFPGLADYEQFCGTG
jgi:molybdopterin/thiamine biosynthesis adenylyltransferase/rhodanese-related sulfurtransferase